MYRYLMRKCAFTYVYISAIICVLHVVKQVPPTIRISNGTLACWLGVWRDTSPRRSQAVHWLSAFQLTSPNRLEAQGAWATLAGSWLGCFHVEGDAGHEKIRNITPMMTVMSQPAALSAYRHPVPAPFVGLGHLGETGTLDY